MSTTVNERPLGDLFNQLFDQISTLVRQEFSLARTELTQRAQVALRDGIVFGMAGALALAALLTAVAALVLGLVRLGVTPWASALIVAGVLAIVAAVMVQGRLRAIRARATAPVQAIESLKEDVQWIKNQTAGSSTSSRPS